MVQLAKALLAGELQAGAGRKRSTKWWLTHIQSLQTPSAEGARATTSYLHNYLNTIKQLMDKY